MNKSIRLLTCCDLYTVRIETYFLTLIYNMCRFCRDTRCNYFEMFTAVYLYLALYQTRHDISISHHFKLSNAVNMTLSCKSVALQIVLIVISFLRYLTV